jgi:autotransporter-associated beta strand protein
MLLVGANDKNNSLMHGGPMGCRGWHLYPWLAAPAALWMVLAGLASALDVVNYSANVNDRFASGFPTAPVPNTDASFVGLDYDWSGVAWSTTTYAASSYKGFGMLSPRHYLAATHYSAAAGLRLRLDDGTVVEGTPQSVTNTAFGFPISGTTPDIALGKLSAPIVGFPAMARYAVLDLNNSSGSDSLANYAGQTLLVYGRGASTNDSPRIASSSITSATTTAYGANNGYMTSPTTTYTLVGGDSGSPAFIPWTNPNGGSELTIIGNNAAVDPGNNNIQNFIGRAAIMNEFNSIMNPDGFSLRIEGNVSNTWVGSSSQNITNKGAWGIVQGNLNAPSDRYVLFDAATAGGERSVVVDGASNQRGMYFKSTAAADDGFTFSGASTLTIGRGGITNYDNSRQTISAPIALGASQYWDVGSGGVTAGAINSAGFLLEVAGSGTGIISGAVSGTGGVALSGTRLEMTGTSSYTGGTWVHSGALVVNGSIASSSGVTVNAGGRLAGSGVVAAIAGSGAVDPGNSPGILTAPSVDPTGGLDFNFEFTQLGSPTWGNAIASGNDVLRLTSPSAPFTASLTSSNAINVYLDIGSLAVGDTFRGGFFTDRDRAFLGSISGASFNYFVADAVGGVSYGGTSYMPYNGPFTFDWSTVVETATFSGGSETGYVTQFVVVPEPGTWLLLAVAVAGGVAVRARRRARL